MISSEVETMSKNITIDELTRVEGHGGIEISLKDGKIEDVKFNVFEGPRFFEHAIKSVYYEKIPDITRRICAICTASHSLASIGAIEHAFDVKVTPQTQALRDILIHGEMIESHALHVFMLALPDFLGFPDAIHMASKHLDAVKAALELKKTGNMIHTAMSGRDVHGMNDRVGGFSKIPTEKQLIEIKESLEAVKPTTELAVKLLAGFDLPAYNISENTLMAIDPGEQFGFLGDSILVSDQTVHPETDYEKLTNEKVVRHSYAKHSTYKGKPFMVGSLARVQLSNKKLEGTAASLYKEHKDKLQQRNTISNNLAQAIELVHSVDRARDVIEQLLADGLKQEALTEFEVYASRGINAVEAPRGLLYHDYAFNDDGTIMKSNIITPTAQNAANIEKDARIIAENLSGKPEAELVKALEIMARAYDPCISCSVHLVHL
ncbi:MAG TPA: Ni/Fe hydrogenase subunit alpha [Candidatus Bathyarchaeota archaeon]|nr:Ni/Fe hydrogenase subunit alpha [Candidatus Bathyarchaeota archaeon]